MIEMNHGFGLLISQRYHATKVLICTAAKTGHFEMLKKSLENEDANDQRNEKGETPFLLSCKYGHFRVAEMLSQCKNLRYQAITF